MENKKKKIYTPAAIVSHPGSMLRTGFVETYNLDIEMVAQMLDISRGHLSRVLNSRAPVTPKLAARLEALTGMAAQKWLILQEEYDSRQLEKDQKYQEYKEAASQWREKFINSEAQKPDESYHVVAELAKKAFAKEITA
jgi:addiction module HigA family antidote